MSLATALRDIALRNMDDDVAKGIVDQYSRKMTKELASSSADDIAEKFGNIISTHQITPDKLSQAAELGGFVQPSIAAIDPSKGRNFLPGSDFGDIVMVPKASMVDPSIPQNRTVLGDRDIYSPRFPETTHEINQSAMQQFVKDHGMSEASFMSNFEFDNPGNAAFRDAFKNTNPQYADMLSYDLRKLPEFEDFANKHMEELRGRKIIKFNDYDGSERIAPYTAENANRAMNILESAGSEQGFQASPTRAYMEQAKLLGSLDDIYKNRHRFISSDVGEVTKDNITDKYGEVLEKIRNERPDLGGGLFHDEAGEFMNKALKRPAAGKDLSDDVKGEIKELRALYKDVPTSYFEAKPRRVVQGDEFYGAYVPHDAPEKVIEDLRALGVENINRYNGREALEDELVALSKNGKRGVSPYVLGLGGALPVGGALASILGGGSDNNYA